MHALKKVAHPIDYLFNSVGMCVFVCACVSVCTGGEAGGTAQGRCGRTVPYLRILFGCSLNRVDTHE